MNALFEPFQYEFMRKALLGCVLIGFTNGYLSRFIVLRRHALLADGLSHSLLPGLAIGAILFSLNPLGLFLDALVAALLMAGKMIARSLSCRRLTLISYPNCTTVKKWIEAPARNGPLRPSYETTITP